MIPVRTGSRSWIEEKMSGEMWTIWRGCRDGQESGEAKSEGEEKTDRVVESHATNDTNNKSKDQDFLKPFRRCPAIETILSDAEQMRSGIGLGEDSREGSKERN
jgi:hypothetical protein